MGIMAIGRIIILSALIAQQAISAPTSGCIETCNFLETSIQQTSGGFQDHANFVQGRTQLNEHDYTRPGNWTERNQYNTDGGHGKVHEERGQYVEGAKRVRDFKKNFTSSYGTGNLNGIDTAELGELSGQRRYESLHVPTNQHIDQSAYGLGQTVTKETGYNRMHSQQSQSLSARIDSKSERLEDFGEYDTQHHVEAAPGNNWNRVDSYRTDGGRGHVFEEEGQYVTGPKKVRYYKKNYTSSYSSSIPQSSVPQSSVGSATLDELHSELQKDLDSIRKNLHQVSSTGHTAATTHVGSTQVGLTQDTAGFHDLQTAESDGYRQHSGYHGVPSTGSVRHYTDQQQRETLTDVRQHVPSYTYPTAAANTYGTESHRTYQSQETHTSQVHPVPQSSHLSPGYVQVPRGSYQTNYHNVHSSGHHLDETEARAQTLRIQNQVLAEPSQHNPHLSHVTYPSRQGETRRYEEHWRSSSHTGGSVVPERTTMGVADYSGHGAGTVGHAERAHYDRDAYNEHRGRYNTAHQGYESRARTSGSSYDSAYRESSGQLVTGSLDLGHAAHGADCTEETHQHYQHETKYHRKYKRDAHHGDVQQHQAIDNEDFTQQNQEFGQETQQLEDLTQQSEQTNGKLEFGQQIVDNQHFDDLAQQSEQHTQQTEGQFEFGQQTVDNPHLEDLTQQSEQFTQQTQGQLEFGQQTVDNPHLEDLSQQNEQFTQQTQGLDHLTQQMSDKLEFGQQTVDGQHLDDLTQQSEQFTQQTQGQLEFGQQTIDNQHIDNLMQQTQGSDDFTQQTSGKLEFGQQIDDSQQLEKSAQRTISDNLTQQTQLGKRELGQQTVGNEHLDDLTQQSEQFTQQTVGQLPKSQRLEEFNEQSEDFTQQTGRFNDFTQQTMGHLEFGRLQQPHRFSEPNVGNHHLEDFTQQNEDLTQHVGRFDDFSQQTAGHFEYGQQSEQQQKPRWPGHYTQHMEHSQQNEWDTDSHSQQSRQYPSYDNKNIEQSEWQLEQMSQKTNFDRDFTQRTDQDQLATNAKPAPKPKPRPRYQKHDFITPRTDGTDTIVDDVFKPVEVNPEPDIDNSHGRIIVSGSRATYPGSDQHTSKVSYSTQGSNVFDNQGETIDRTHSVHKSNDATIGLQWHYTYHPSDLTNVEGSPDNYYSRHDVNSMSQQTEDIQRSRPFDFNQQAQNEDILENSHQNSYAPQSSQHDKYDQQSGSFQQTETFSRFDNQDSDRIASRVIPLQRHENAHLTAEQETPTTEQTEDNPESRILQAYGGSYDASRNDDFYTRIKPNPSATLPPMDGDDPWDIREKPRGTVIPRIWSTVRNTPEIVTTTEITPTAETTTQPSFWSRVGHKITNTYDKAKEKAKEIFG
ncbi:PREDICTED: putative mediator of RNA polymerase II transcription subunit 26 [Wasmannia auropunctata]|uniref:putative mediator of RNA polymerase II transcription subunit 26 n=1 Tax=Wasmannia auropunctata TaxID=64793 RepID=UPI0005EE6739|nr:PREDICTED: putative mediator of RNA polymerase II transcription subunit 26 [Wasmannia auropunctata]XP_011703268.1 PREDICTED: putative mediator of RNA polymerase II transcription subunit 26 [Wasmannia auropunctata]